MLDSVCCARVLQKLWSHSIDIQQTSLSPCFYRLVIIHDIRGRAAVSANNAQNEWFLYELLLTPEKMHNHIKSSKVQHDLVSVTRIWFPHCWFVVNQCEMNSVSFFLVEDQMNWTAGLKTPEMTSYIYLVWRAFIFLVLIWYIWDMLLYVGWWYWPKYAVLYRTPPSVQALS